MNLNHPANIMDKEKSAVEQFLEGTGNESMFQQPPKDPFEKSNEDFKEGEKKEEKEEKALPYHKDTKLQKYIDKELEKRLKEFKPEAPKEEKKEDDDYYARLIGNDTPEKVAMIKEAKARDERLLNQAEERAFNRLSQKEQEELRASKEAAEELSNAFENIEENYGVDLNSSTSKKTRAEFIDFVEKIAPKRDGEITGYPDMNSAWETFSEIKKSTSQPSRAKELASRSMARSAETSVKQEKRIDWNSVDEMMDTLK